jgi:hypothetical protein
MVDRRMVDMIQGNSSRFLAFLTSALFMLGAFGAAAQAFSGEGGAQARAADNEPNDDANSAATLADGEVVQGSLRVSSQWDTQDWYKMDVPPGKVLNASLYLADYDDTNIGRYNIHLRVYGQMSGQNPTPLDASETKNRWECVAGVQYWNASAPRTMYLRIQVNYSSGWNPQVRTDPTHYTISASLSDVPDFQCDGPEVSAYLDGGTGPLGRAFYKLNPGPADYQIMRGRLVPPANGIFAINAFLAYPIDGGWYRQNASWINSAGTYQNIVFNGNGGTCYVRLDGLGGNGTYKLSVNNEGRSLDENNIPGKAQTIRDNNPHASFLDQGVNFVDWFRIDCKAGRPIPEAYITFLAGMFQDDSTFDLQVYDKDLNYLNGTSIPRWLGGNNWADYAFIQNTAVPYDGPVYFMVHANGYGGNTTAQWEGGNGWYTLTFTLPNDRPVFNGPVPTLHILEDTSDDSLVLAQYFSDPDNDSMTYSILGSNFKSRPRINTSTGRINFTPEANWSGTELLRFRATDTGPGNLWVEGNVTVVVDSVNDPPRLLGTLDDMILVEEQGGQTPNLASLFSDNDDPAENLSYSMRIIGQDTRPAGTSLPYRYDSTAKAFMLGPVYSGYGSFRLEVSCTDRHIGTVAPAIEFNLTVNHRNHAPARAPLVNDPIRMTIEERGQNSSLVIPDLFTDQDLPEDYAADKLTFNFSGQKDLLVKLGTDGRMSIDTGTVQYYPGKPVTETILVTARDKAGLKAVLNISVTVSPIDDPPGITTALPENTDFQATEGKKEAFRITAQDNDTEPALLVYAWYLDGVKDKTQVGTVYNFYPDYKMGGTIHQLKAVVTDGTTEASTEWTITVRDVNRLPAVSISQPVNFTKFKRGEFITFTADARDEDGDNLTYVWRDGAGILLGTGLSMSTDKLEAGTQTVRLEVNDGKGSIYCDVVVMIAKPSTPTTSKGFIPGFETAAAVAAAASAIVAVGLARRKKDG